MRIAMVAVERSPNLTGLAIELGVQGHEVMIYTRREQPGRHRKTLAPGVVVSYLAAGPERPVDSSELLAHLGEFGRRLAARWARRRPDVVHAHGWASGLAVLSGSGLTRSARPPMLQSYGLLAGRSGPRGPTIGLDREAQTRLERALGRTAEASVVPCGQDKSDLVRFGVPPGRVDIVPGAVNAEQFTRKGPAFSRRTDGIRLLTMTGPEPEDGAGTTVRALTGVPGAQLIVEGGPEPESLETDPAAHRLLLLAKELGVDDRVILLGRVPARRRPSLIRSADLLLALGRYDPYGTAVLQAMACGVPVVATNEGGHLDTVLDNVTGILLPRMTPDAVGQCLRRLLVDPTRIQAFGYAGEDRARTRHTWSRIAAETHGIYERITA